MSNIILPSSRHPDERVHLVARIMQVVDYLFGVLYVLIGFEFVLEFAAARDGNAFKQFLDALASPFLDPFRTLLPTFSLGGSQLIASYLVALITYAVLHAGLRRLARMATEPAPAP